LLGGVTFTITDPGKTGASVTFPTYYKNDRPYINLKSIPQLLKDTAKEKLKLDLFMQAANKELINKSKFIEIEGIKSIADSVVSIYNDEGFKAMALFDEQMNYTSELAIPLKYLDILTDKAGKFKYTIRLNGAVANGSRMQLSSSGRFLLVTRNGDAPYAIPASPQFMSYAYPTDLSGEYTLTIKP
jgi:hypothetical protein